MAKKPNTTAPATPATPATPAVTPATPAVTPAVTPATPVAREDVSTLIREAGEAAGTMYAKTREAARLAAAQLDESKPIGDRIKAVVSLYSDALASAGHNIRAIFSDAVTLIAAASTPVSVEVFKPDGSKEEKHVEAAEAVDLSKNAMRAAAKEAREALGIGRKSGGGRKPGEKAVANAANAEAVAKVATEADQFSAWLDGLDHFVIDAVYHEKIRARLIELGFTLGRAVQGRKIDGKAQA